MSENANEIFGQGVTVGGRDITWFRPVEPGETPYPYTLIEPFEDPT